MKARNASGLTDVAGRSPRGEMRIGSRAAGEFRVKPGSGRISSKVVPQLNESTATNAPTPRKSLAILTSMNE